MIKLAIRCAREAPSRESNWDIEEPMTSILFRGRLADSCVSDGIGSRFGRRGMVKINLRSEQTAWGYDGNDGKKTWNGRIISSTSLGRVGDDVRSSGDYDIKSWACSGIYKGWVTHNCPDCLSKERIIIMRQEIGQNLLSEIRGSSKFLGSELVW